MNVQGVELDPNYTLAVNVGSGLVFELANSEAPEQPGIWSAEHRPGARRRVDLHGGRQDVQRLRLHHGRAVVAGVAVLAVSALAVPFLARPGEQSPGVSFSERRPADLRPQVRRLPSDQLRVPRPATRGSAYGDLVRVSSALQPAFERVLPGRPELSYLLTHVPDPSRENLLTDADRDRDRAVDSAKGRGTISRVPLLTAAEAPILARIWYRRGRHGLAAHALARERARHARDADAVPGRRSWARAPSTSRRRSSSIVRVSQLNGCRYCLAAHRPIALEAGVPAQHVEAVCDGAPLDSAAGARTGRSSPGSTRSFATRAASRRSSSRGRSSTFARTSSSS